MKTHTNGRLERIYDAIKWPTPPANRQNENMQTMKIIILENKERMELWKYSDLIYQDNRQAQQ